MLILYRLKLYQFDPELPSALNMLAVAVQSNICFSFLLLLLFYFFSPPPPPPKSSCCSAGWVLGSVVGEDADSLVEKCTWGTRWVLLTQVWHTPGLLASHQVSWHFSDLSAARPFPLGLPPPISWCTTFLNPVFEHIPAQFLFSPAHYHYCSVLLICFVSPLRSLSLWEEYNDRNLLFTCEDSPEQRSVKVSCVQCVQVLGLCTPVSSAQAAALGNSCHGLSLSSILQLSLFSPLKPKSGAFLPFHTSN